MTPKKSSERNYLVRRYSSVTTFSAKRSPAPSRDSADPSRLFGNGRGAPAAGTSPGGHARGGRRNDWRNGHAAQPVLHSALVQTRNIGRDEDCIRTAIRFNTVDAAVALTIAFFVNAAILVLAAMVFYGKQVWLWAAEAW